MRRLPVYFLVDVSESMCGHTHEQLQTAMQSIIADLRTDPQALETVHVAVVAFAGKAKTLAPLAELTAFAVPRLPLGGGTALGAALLHLFQHFDRDLRKPTHSQKGDWKPLVFLLTDGHPTDDVSSSLNAWTKTYRKSCRMVAVSFGGEADHGLLGRFTEEIVTFDPQATGAFARFAMWVSRSIGVTSTALERGAETTVRQDATITKDGPIQLAKPTAERSARADERYAFVVGKCTRKKTAYLLKYRRGDNSRRFEFQLGSPLPDQYFEMCDGPSKMTISTSQIDATKPCPVCEAACSIAVCGCGGVLCMEFSGGDHTCPWCGKRGHFAPAGHLNIGRGFG